MQISLILEDKSIICTEEIVPANRCASLDTQEGETVSCAAGKWAAFPVTKQIAMAMLPFFLLSHKGRDTVKDQGKGPKQTKFKK